MIEKVKNKLINSSINQLTVEIFTSLRRKKARKRLVNKDFSIISSNCTGGIIYHELGHNFLSPTINLLISSKDFVRFALNLEDYLKEDLVFFDGDENCPTARLGDIVIKFVHYENEQIAREKWNQRKQRINWNNLYFILNDRDGITYEDIVRLKNVKCKNMVIFTSHRYEDCPNTFLMPEFEGQKEVGYTLDHLPITGEWYFERFFDYVGWLNSDHEDCERFRK